MPLFQPQHRVVFKPGVVTLLLKVQIGLTLTLFTAKLLMGNIATTQLQGSLSDGELRLLSVLSV